MHERSPKSIRAFLSYVRFLVKVPGGGGDHISVSTVLFHVITIYTNTLNQAVSTCTRPPKLTATFSSSIDCNSNIILYYFISQLNNDTHRTQHGGVPPPSAF